MEFPDEYMAFLVVKVTANCCQLYRSPVSKMNWGQLDNSESRTKLVYGDTLLIVLLGSSTKQ